jgi:hypothetical protein
MKVEVHIVGTSHSYQFGAGSTFGAETSSQDAADAFQSFLVSAARTIYATVICEELSCEALTAVGATVSVPENVAANLGLAHLFCDPDSSERRVLDILNENEIRIHAELFNRPKSTEAEIQKRISQHYRKREVEWYRRIIEARSTPILFICGSNHVDSFYELLRSKGVQVSVICQDWSA